MKDEIVTGKFITAEISLDIHRLYDLESQNADSRIQHLTYCLDAMNFFLDQACQGIEAAEYTKNGKEMILNHLTSHTQTFCRLMKGISTAIDIERENLINGIEKELGIDFIARNKPSDLSASSKLQQATGENK